MFRMLKQIVQCVQIRSIIELQMSYHSYKKIINFEETKKEISLGEVFKELK